MNDKSSLRHFPLRDFIIGFTLLSLIPMPHLRDEDWSNPADASWTFPIIGAVLGALAGLVGAVALSVGLTAEIAAALALATLVMLTGAMHEDGLSDCADGFGGRTPSARLAIMKDSQIGCYGAIALVLSLLLRWVLLVSLVNHSLFAAMIAVGALSRAPISTLAFSLPHARDNGLSKGFGKTSGPVALASGAIGLLIGMIWMGASAIAAAIGVAVVTFFLAKLAIKLIGGQTGDVYGASQQVAEISALLAFAILI